MDFLRRMFAKLLAFLKLPDIQDSAAVRQSTTGRLDGLSAMDQTRGPWPLLRAVS